MFKPRTVLGPPPPRDRGAHAAVGPASNGVRVRGRGSFYTVGITAGVVYGLAIRLLVWATGAVRDTPGSEVSPTGLQAFYRMSIGFVFVVPFVIGILTVHGAPAPRWTTRVFAPWLPVLVSMLAAAAVGWEGAICLAMAAPAWLVMASLGGVAEV